MKMSEYCRVTLVSFDVLSLNGEGADETLKDVYRVSVNVTRTHGAEYYGEEDEWELSATYRGDASKNSLNVTHAEVTVRRYFRTNNFGDFIIAISRFIRSLNSTDIVTRSGWLSLKTDMWEESDTRAVLLTGYGIDEY